jgi:EpsI family protein
MKTTKYNYLTVLVLLFITWCYTQVYYVPASHIFASAEFVQKARDFPREIGDWKYKCDIVMNEAGYKALNPQALIFREYVNNRGESIVLAVVYHENQRWGAHDVEVCYTSQGWKTIKTDGLSTQRVKLRTIPITVNKMEFENLKEKKTVVYWWFTEKNQQMADRLQQMINNIRSSLLHGYCVSGLIRISAEGGEKAFAAISDFAEQLMPVLEQYLP